MIHYNCRNCDCDLNVGEEQRLGICDDCLEAEVAWQDDEAAKEAEE
jgi:hypothetical protein